MPDEYHFPLHVLVISASTHSDDRVGLARCLRQDPAVRSMGFATSRGAARALLDKYEINTIMIDPSAGSDSPAPFIDEVRRDFPKIVWVIFTRPWVREYFLNEEPRFEHYFYLSHFDVLRSQDEVGTSACSNVLRRCEEWHKERFQYDVALSFAGSNRAEAESVAKALQDEGVRVFYDDFEQSELFGRDLFTFLYDVYSRRCRYCALLISQDYVRRMWTIHERAAAQERALRERGNTYILPIRLDETPVPGLSGNIAYVPFSTGVDKIARLVADKIHVRDADERKVYFGPDEYTW